MLLDVCLVLAPLCLKRKIAWFFRFYQHTPLSFKLNELSAKRLMVLFEKCLSMVRETVKGLNYQCETPLKYVALFLNVDVLVL